MRHGLLLAFVAVGAAAQTPVAAETFEPALLPEEACRELRAKVRFQVQFRQVQLEKLLQTLADATCFTFIVEPGARAVVTIHPSDDQAVPEWSNDRFFTEVVGELKKQGVVVKEEGPPWKPRRYRVSGPLPRPCTDDSELAKGVTAVDPWTREINRSVVEDQLQNLACPASTARIMPAFRNGVVDGFKIFLIRPGSIYALLGFQNGDVFRSLNDMRLSTPDAGVGIYTKLKQAEVIKVVLVRSGEPLTLTLKIHGPRGSAELARSLTAVDLWTREIKRPVIEALHPTLTPMRCIDDAEAAKGITSADPWTREITRSVIDSLLQNPNCGATSASMAPIFKDGVAVGLRVFAIRPGSTWDLLGLKNADILTSVNDRTVHSPLELHANLKEASLNKVAILREGEPRILAWTIH